MKKIVVGLFIALFILATYIVHPALAQSETAPTVPTGQVIGKVINQNTGKVVAHTMDVMLHIVDQNYADKGMLHGQSQPNGSFVFADVPFDPSLGYAVMAVYDDVTYYSDVIPADMDSRQTTVNVPVFESTADVSTVQIDQMHVMFELVEDGLETKEIYVFSNMGERTVKNAYDVGNGQFATLKFPLPSDADFVFYKPEDKDRFIKVDDGFADVYPLLPGAQSSQIMVSYLVPFSGKRTYTYTAPLNVERINFLVPEEADITLKGEGLTGPESMDLEAGESYDVYSYVGLTDGQTVSISLQGSLAGFGSFANTNTIIALGAAFLGFVAIGAGIWWWRRPDEVDEETDGRPDAVTDLDQLLNEIAQLDQAHERGEVSEDRYAEFRAALRKKAKALMEQEDKEA